MESKDYSNEIDLRRVCRELKHRKWLYTAVFAIILGAAVAFVWRKEPEFTAHSTMLIENSSSEGQGRGGSLMQMMRVFSTGGFASSSVDNELLLVNTRDVALRAVKAMNLNITCFQKHGLRSKTLFADTPLTLSIPESVADTLSNGYNVKVWIKDGKADIKVYRGRFFKTTILEQHSLSLPCTVDTPSGPFTLAATGELPAKATYIFGVDGYQNTADYLFNEVKTEVCDKMADGIEFSYSSPNRDKAKAVLNTMMQEYNAKRVERKKETAQAELNFLTDRINNLYSDLVESEHKVAEFKTEQQFVDIESEAPILLEKSMTSQEELIKAAASVMYYEQVLQILQSGKDGMLPAVSAPGEEKSSQSSSMVSDYNSQMALLLELRRSAKPGNHALTAAETRVAQMKESIITSFTELLKASQRTIATRNSVVGAMESHIRKLPAVEREYINLSRDQLLKNELYAFLVEKRESALLKINSQETLGFIIDPAYVEPNPSLKKSLIYIALGFVAAVACLASLLLLYLRRTDYITHRFDFKNAGMEDNAFDCTPGDYSVNDVRAEIIHRMPAGKVFIASYGGSIATKAADRLTESFGNAGIECGVFKTEGTGNDPFLAPAVQKRISDMAASYRYVFATVPDFDRIKDIATAVCNDDSLLIIFVAKGSLTRTHLSQAIGTADTARILAVIVSES